MKALALRSMLAALLLCVYGGTGSAAGARPPEVTLALACLGETGWHVDMCVVETWIHVKRAGGDVRAADDVALLYSSFLKRPQRSRAHLLLLRPSGSPPTAWPRSRRRWWRVYQERFVLLVNAVRGVLSGQIPDPCPESIHYGGPESLDPFPESWRGRFEVDDSCEPAMRSLQRTYRRVREVTR